MPKTILVADDSRTIQRAVQIALSEEDIELVGVRKSANVLAKALELRPDAILLDNQFHQSGPDGYDLCEAIKGDPTIGNTPVGFLASQSYDESKGESVGALLSVAKPFESKKLIEGINKLLEFASVSSSFLPAAEEPEGLFDSDATPAEPEQAEIMNQPVPRETTAMPTFNPVAFSNMLPDADGSGGGTPAIDPSALLGDDSIPDDVGPEQEALSPPSLMTPPPVPQAPADEPEPLSFEPPPLPPEPAAPLQPPPLPPAIPAPPAFTFSEPDPEPEPVDAPKAKAKPLIIPEPSDAPKEFPVEGLLNPAPISDEPSMEPPSFLDKETEAETFADSSSAGEMTTIDHIPAAAVSAPVVPREEPAPAPAGGNLAALATSAGLRVPDFALRPDDDYLARALDGSRQPTLRRAASLSDAPAEQVGAVKGAASEVVERIAWEVVPEIAELLIREMIGQQR